MLPEARDTPLNKTKNADLTELMSSSGETNSKCKSTNSKTVCEKVVSASGKKRKMGWGQFAV